jgi:hypothetical protein
MHLLLEKLLDKTFSRTRENMVTLALMRRRVGALVTQTLVALSTIYTWNLAS